MVLLMNLPGRHGQQRFTPVNVTNRPQEERSLQ